MEAPLVPDNEKERLRALHGMCLLDTLPDMRFDRLTRIAKQLFQVPIVLVSLVDSNRQWFKSCQGLDTRETPRDISFCGHAILDGEVFCVPDTLLDPRFANNPLVSGAPHIRFYAGAPLSSADGYLVGTLCIIDHKPRTLSASDHRTLRDLADCVEDELAKSDLVTSARLLAHEQARMKVLMDNVVDGIITIDDKGKMLSFNRAAERIFGYGADELVGQNVNILMPSPYRDEHNGYLRHYMETGEARIIGIGREVRGRRKDGGVFPLDLAVSEVEYAEQRMFTGIVRDITARKEAERALIEARNQAERANRHKSVFLNVMSHELRTPLTVILGYLPLLKNHRQLPDQASIEQIANDMDISGQHLLALINDVLDISKIEAGQMILQREQTPVLPLLQEMKRRFQHEAETKGIKLLIECDDFTFGVDIRRLRQILINLIGNALKFTGRGSIKISAEHDTESARFNISDTGSGIPAAEQAHIFDAFRQVDDSSTREVGGSGLGLAITRRLVELHGGTISVQSEPGVGTTFTFNLKQWGGME